MEGGDGGVQPRSHRSPSTRIKRKKSPIKNRSAHSIKRQKIVFNKEIVTQEFDSAQNRPSSSTSIPDSCSTRKHKGRKIKRSRFRDNSRQWVWCSRDFSSYRGNGNLSLCIDCIFFFFYEEWWVHFFMGQFIFSLIWSFPQNDGHSF